MAKEAWGRWGEQDEAGAPNLIGPSQVRLAASLVRTGQAPCHAWFDDHLYNGFPGSTVRSTTRALRCGIEKMPPLVTRGVLLDVVALRGEVVKPGETIGRSELQEAASRAGLELRDGDAVLIRTGWLES